MLEELLNTTIAAFSSSSVAKMTQRLSISLLLLLSSSCLAQGETKIPPDFRQLLKKSNRKDSNTDGQTTEVTNEGEYLRTCYYNLLSSSNYDSILSQSDFLTFVNLQSLGLGVTTSWGTNITSFNQLSPKFIGVYNEFACGEALVGCPSIEGIEIENVYDLENGFLGRLCESMEDAVEAYRMEVSWTGSDAASKDDQSVGETQ